MLLSVFEFFNQFCHVLSELIAISVYILKRNGQKLITYFLVYGAPGEFCQKTETRLFALIISIILRTDNWRTILAKTFTNY